jgi:DNA ligase-associated metallophosphoesterase
MSSSEMMTFNVGAESLWLLPQKAAFLPASHTLLIADAHFGKAVSFRKLGVPVPAGTTGETLAALSDLIGQLEVRRIVFLGDFLHSPHSLAPATLAELTRWRAVHRGIELTLVRGNHDDRAGDPPKSLEIQTCDEPLMQRGLAFSHHPRAVPGAYVLAGHLHPCINLGGRAHDWHRLPCFCFGDEVAILPAFGAFTGMHPIRARAGQRVFAAAPDRVFEVQIKPDSR